MTRPLQVGDLCITVHTTHPGCNEGLLVVIHHVDHSQRDKHGEAIPFLIRRLDGQPHVSTSDRKTGEFFFATCYEAWCAGYKLRRIEQGEPQIEESVAQRVEV